MRMSFILLLLALTLPVRAQVVGLVLDSVGGQHCVARSNARPLALYDIVSIRRGGFELGQARVVRPGNVCMLRLLTAFSVQRGDQVSFVSAGTPPPPATTSARQRHNASYYGPGPEIPPQHLVVQSPSRPATAPKASFSGQGSSSGMEGG